MNIPDVKEGPKARTPIACSDLLSALDQYNKRHPRASRGYHKLQLYADGSGFLIDPWENRADDFDSIEGALEKLHR